MLLLSCAACGLHASVSVLLSYISIYISIYILSYFAEQENKKILGVLLTSPRSLGEISGSRLSIHFSSTLDVLQAAQKVFGSAKRKVGYVALPGTHRTGTQSFDSSQSAQFMTQ